MIFVLISIVLPLLLGEFTALAPTLAQRLTRAAARRIPQGWREIYEVEWIVELDQAPGKLWKLWWAFGLWVKLPSIIRSARENVRPPQITQIPELGAMELKHLELIALAFSLETSQHREKVMEMSTDFGRFLGLAQSSVDNLRIGAMLHDLGKVAVPPDILNKRGKLASGEVQVLRQHTEAGHELGLSLNLHPEALQVISFHHERWDGQGYPYRMAGATIPLAARVFSIIDIYDALTGERSYKPAWPHQEAMQAINDIAGKHLDPQLVAKFSEFIEDSKWKGPAGLDLL